MPTTHSIGYAFSAYAVPTAVTTVLMLALGASVLFRRPSRVSAALFGMTFAASLWQFAFTFMYSTNDPALALMWSRVAYLGVPFLAPAIYQFAVEMLRITPQRRAPLIAGWVLAAVFSVAALSGLLVTHVTKYWWGFYPRYSIAVSIPFLTVFFGYLVAALVEFIRAHPKSTGVERTRIRLLILAFGIAYLGCVDYLPKYGIAAYPFGYIPILAFVAVVAHTVHKYDLVAITPSLAAREIIGTMADALFVCDRDGRIQFANNAVTTLLGYEPQELVGRDIDELMDWGTEGDVSDKLRRKSIRNAEFVFVGRNNEHVDMTLSIAPIAHEGQPAGAVLIGRDVRERKRAEREIREAMTLLQSTLNALRESEERYRLLFEQNAAGVCSASTDGTIIDSNDTFAHMLGYKRAELSGRNVSELYVRPVERDELTQMLRDAKTLNSIEVELCRKDGSRVWALQNLVLVDESIVHATVVDISDRKRAEEQIEFHAYHDVLTGLPNRKLFTDRLSHSLSRARRSGRSLAVMFVDLDHFKTINDTLGHEAGDELLLEMARRLRNCVREDDTVARLGGDEFTLVLSDLRHPEDAVNVALKIIDAVQVPMAIAGSPIEVTASVGISLFPADGQDPESLLRNADSAMYRAKESGRNNYQLCTDDMKKRANERLSLESRLRRALHEDQLLLHYQPQVSLVTGRIIGAEALVRWNDPEHGLIEPSEFIPVAEETRLILPLGEWVLRTACRQAKEWHEAGAYPMRVSVNLSARQFQQHDLVHMVRSALDDARLDPAALELEITETTAMQNGEITVEILRALRAIGVGISIDDFGTGYSSLNYLKRFPINAVKIDQGFVHDLATSEEDAAIVGAVIGIARSLHLRVIAEGVETEDQLEFLQRRNCDEAQGFYFARPMHAAVLADAMLGGRKLVRQEPRLTV